MVAVTALVRRSRPESPGWQPRTISKRVDVILVKKSRRPALLNTVSPLVAKLAPGPADFPAFPRKSSADPSFRPVRLRTFKDKLLISLRFPSA